MVHGGLFSKDGVTLDDIRKIERIGQQPGQEGLMCTRIPLLIDVIKHLLGLFGRFRRGERRLLHLSSGEEEL